METLVEIADDSDLPGALAALEQGSILLLPRLRFDLAESERRFLSPASLDGKAKNISFDPHSGLVRGASAGDRNGLRDLLRRFSEWAREEMSRLCPGYRGHLRPGLASFRPAEIAGRPSSWRKDDTRLHVDAFPSRPMQGRRILRLFVNAGTAPRVWRAGEPFEHVAQTFLTRLRAPLPGASWLLRCLRLTRQTRTPYDHFMLGIHDAMKADTVYQSAAAQSEIPFAPGAVWACYTDLVSHAAMSGQFAFEQTFYLPVSAMQDPARSPLRILERLRGSRLA